MQRRSSLPPSRPAGPLAREHGTMHRAARRCVGSVKRRKNRMRAAFWPGFGASPHGDRLRREWFQLPVTVGTLALAIARTHALVLNLIAVARPWPRQQTPCEDGTAGRLAIAVHWVVRAPVAYPRASGRRAQDGGTQRCIRGSLFRRAPAPHRLRGCRGDAGMQPPGAHGGSCSCTRRAVAPRPGRRFGTDAPFWNNAGSRQRACALASPGRTP